MIELINISKSYPTGNLYTDLNLRLNSGDKVGLVGRNGTGKSTLFKLILGEEHPDTGEIKFPKNYKIGALKQYFDFKEKKLLDETASALSEENKYDVYKAEKMLFGLGFSEADLNKDPKSFSGGFQIRINLAKLLLTEPNMLLLDEPTNYLDILSIRWLKAFLKTFQGEVILITHDREFMDSVCTHTLGIVRRSAFMIPGGTRKFFEQISANEEHYEKQKIAQDKKIKDLEEFIAKNKARAATATLAQSKVKILEKMEILEDINYDANLDFDFNYKETAAKFLVEVKDLSFGYTADNILFKNISFALTRGETIGIIGKNGKGKSTLLNAIAGELEPLSGSVDFHPSCTFGHFGQTNISHLNPKNTIMDEIYSVNHKLPEAVIRSICGLMMFSGDNAKKKISLLSGGEKSRVMLGKIIAQDVNLLFLDEPTNHLDIDSIDALTEAIKRFNGSCIIVTHSEELLKAVCDKLIVFRDDKAEYFNGNYNEFLEQIGWEDDAGAEKPKSVKPKRNKKEIKKLRAAIVTQKSQATKPIKNEIEKIEALNDAQKSKMQSKLNELNKELEKLNAEFQIKLDEI
ncbi:ABC-F family ATP-binding cassette domain-containing protein [Arcobacter sp. 15-2]|uniref:ABC-F family ATP-binding cassette domain-containing protein n=1 Tax=Arcobacter sp. 15-2 TaxID=3374109 RepID=UPI00399C6F27